MSFYTEFAAAYERIFPLRVATLEFLAERLPSRGRIVDLGCGTGHYAGRLTAAGHEVVGIDRDAAMITAARARYPAAAFVEADLATAPVDLAPIAAAYSIGNVLPHLPRDVVTGFLADLGRALVDDGPWIIQIVNFERLLPRDDPFDFPPLEAGDGYVFHRRYRPCPDGSVRFETALAQGGHPVFSGVETLWPVGRDDLVGLHADAGLRLEAEYGGYDGQGFTASRSPALIQVYRR